MKKQLEAGPLPLGTLFRLGWQLYNEHFSDILWLILWVYLPVNLVAALLPNDWQLVGGPETTGTQLSITLAQLLEIFWGILATIGIAAMVEQAVQGERMAWSTALRYGLAKWPGAFGTELLGALIVLGLTFLLIIPGIIWAFYYAFSLYAVALRNVRGRSALAYSKGLVQGQWWRICGVILVTSLVAQIVLLVIIALLTLIADNPVAAFIINSTADVIAGYFLVVTVLFFLNTDYVKQKGVE